MLQARCRSCCRHLNERPRIAETNICWQAGRLCLPLPNKITRRVRVCFERSTILNMLLSTKMSHILVVFFFQIFSFFFASKFFCFFFTFFCFQNLTCLLCVKRNSWTPQSFSHFLILLCSSNSRYELRFFFRMSKWFLLFTRFCLFHFLCWQNMVSCPYFN